MGNFQLRKAPAEVPLDESLAGLCTALQDGIDALIAGRLDDFEEAVSLQTIKAATAGKLVRSPAGENLPPEVRDRVREAAMLSRLFHSHLRKLATSIEIAKNLRLLMENKYPGTANHAVSNCLSLKV